MKPRSGAAHPVLSKLELNRATLARQMLLAREKLSPAAAVERLAGLQAQLPRPPYLALWTRLEAFEREALTRAFEKRTLVRATMFRGTLHVVSAKDYLLFRGAMQSMLSAGMRSVLRQRAEGIDVERTVELSRKFFGREPATFEQLRDHLAETFPKLDIRALAYIARTHVPVVMVPEDGSTWGYPSAARFTDAEAWVKKKLALGEEMREELALRYLAAFGPASVADMQTWSGLAGLKVELESLREQGKLAVFSDESGRELFDLPQAPRPGAEVDAPVRFLPDFDNLVLAHADRSRLVEKEHLKKIVTKNLQILPTFLVGGLVAGMWKLEAKKSAAKLSLSPFAGRAKLSKQVRAELEEEGERLLTFVEPDVKKKELAWAS